LKSVEQALGAREYARLRIGVEPPHEWRGRKALSDLVLGPFSKAEREEVESLIPRAEKACELWLKDGIIAAMNQFNKKEEPKEE
jgi:peptidyl-tRNA hydrolase, PTH1 family